MLEKDPKIRRDRVDWYAWMVRYEAGESPTELAAEAGCERQAIYRAWTWFSALTPSGRADLRQRAFRRLTAKIESDALRGEIDRACKDARGLETVRRLLDAVEDEMKHPDDTPAAGTRHDDITPEAARAALEDRVRRESARRRDTKAVSGPADRSGGGRGLP